MKTAFKLASYDLYKTKKGENIPVETILDLHVTLQTKPARTVTKPNKEIECWER